MKHKLILLSFFLINQIVLSQVTDPRDDRPFPSGGGMIFTIVVFLIWILSQVFRKETDDEKKENRENKLQRIKKEQQENKYQIEHQQENKLRSKNSEKYYELVRKYFWDENIKDWINPNDEITLDLLLRKYPDSVTLKQFISRPKELYYNFDEYWNVFPVSDQQDGWLRTRTLKTDKIQTEKFYNNKIEKGIKHEYILINLKSELNNRCKTSISRNKLSIMKHSKSWIHQFDMDWDSIIEYDLNRLTNENFKVKNDLKESSKVNMFNSEVDDYLIKEKYNKAAKSITELVLENSRKFGKFGE